MQSEKVIEDRLGSVFYHPGASQSEENKPNSIRSYDHEGRMFSIFHKKGKLVSIDVESIHQDVPRIFSGIDSIPPIEDPFDFYSRWTVAESICKLTNTPILHRIKKHGLPKFPFDSHFIISEEGREFEAISIFNRDLAVIISIVERTH